MKYHSRYPYAVPGAATDQVRVLLEEALKTDDQKEPRYKIRAALALLDAEEVTT